MKNFLLVLLVWLFACNYEREIQATMRVLTLKSMEPIYRYNEEYGCKLTWWDDYNNIEIVSFSYPPDYCDNYIIGVKYRLLIQR